MGRLFLVEVESPCYKCNACNTAVACVQDLLSQYNNHRRGRVAILQNVVNITYGPEREMSLMTGSFTIQDIFCVCCGQLLGWKYITAHDEDLSYMEGLFLIQRDTVKQCI